jgi:hypothetical protein
MMAIDFPTFASVVMMAIDFRQRGGSHKQIELLSQAN